jgi:hypothetical protein
MGLVPKHSRREYKHVDSQEREKLGEDRGYFEPPGEES